MKLRYNTKINDWTGLLSRFLNFRPDINYHEHIHDRFKPQKEISDHKLQFEKIMEHLNLNRIEK